MSRLEAEEIQLDLILDYRSNVALYPKFQDYLRAHRPPLLAIWGKNDKFFIPPGAEAHRQGHFPLLRFPMFAPIQIFTSFREMCGRYRQTTSEEELARLYHHPERTPLPLLTFRLGRIPGHSLI